MNTQRISASFPDLSLFTTFLTMGCAQSHSADDQCAIIRPTGIKDEWTICIEPHSVINGLVRLKLDNWNYFIRYARNLDSNVIFRLHYRKCIESQEWTTIVFDHTDIRCAPHIHLNIRVDVNLLDYNMEFKISTKLNAKFIEITGMEQHLRPNIWLPPSNTVTMHIPSSMKDMSFERNQWVRFRKTSTDTRHSYGTIEKKVFHPNTDDYTYHISHYRNHQIYKIKDNKSDKNANIKHLSAHSYVDLTSITQMEKVLLIGDRMDADNDDVMVLYSCLNGIFYSEYTLKYMQLIENGIHQRSTAKCVALNVIDFLFEKQSQYKIKCPLDHHVHFDDTLRLTPQREYAVGRALCLKEESYYYEYYCDQCLCVQGNYYWMYRCQWEKDIKYNGHDICLNCVYDVIKKCKQLKELLDDMLAKELTDDCIQTIVVYTAGNVVKL